MCLVIWERPDIPGLLRPFGFPDYLPKTGLKSPNYWKRNVQASLFGHILSLLSRASSFCQNAIPIYTRPTTTAISGDSSVSRGIHVHEESGIARKLTTLRGQAHSNVY